MDCLASPTTTRRSGLPRGQEPRDLHLQRVGVLELVDDQEAEAAAEVALAPTRESRSASRALSSRSRKSSSPAAAFFARRAPRRPERARRGVRGGRAPRPAFHSRGRLLRPGRHVPRAASRASGEGQRGLKPKLLRIVGKLREARPGASALRGSGARSREAPRAREPRRQGVPGLHLGHQRRGRARLSRGAPRARPRAPPPPRPGAARGRAARGACAPARAARRARPRRARPRAGSLRPAPRAAWRRRASSRSASHSSQASAKRRSVSASSATRKPGTTPHSRGRSWRIAAQRAWMVEIGGALEHVERRAGPLALRRGAPAVDTRPLQALAQPQLHGGGGVLGEGDGGDLVEPGAPARSRDSMRSTRSVVLPVPGAGLQHEAGDVVVARRGAGLPRRRARSSQHVLAGAARAASRESRSL